MHFPRMNCFPNFEINDGSRHRPLVDSHQNGEIRDHVTQHWCQQPSIQTRKLAPKPSGEDQHAQAVGDSEWLDLAQEDQPVKARV